VQSTCHSGMYIQEVSESEVARILLLINNLYEIQEWFSSSVACYWRASLDLEKDVSTICPTLSKMFLFLANFSPFFNVIGRTLAFAIRTDGFPVGIYIF
jgi:hypothetical protein